MDCKDAEVVIEYCINCSAHQWCTRHDEAKYLSQFTQASEMIKNNFPDITVSSFLAVNAGSNVKPRVGAFEIDIFHSTEGRRQTLFSKISSGVWPSIPGVCRQIEDFLANKPPPIPIGGRPHTAGGAVSARTPRGNNGSSTARSSSGRPKSTGRSRAASSPSRSGPSGASTARSTTSNTVAEPKRTPAKSPKQSSSRPVTAPDKLPSTNLSDTTFGTSTPSAAAEDNNIDWVRLTITDLCDTEEMDKVLTALLSHRDQLKRVFWFYCGRTIDAADDVTSISSNEFFLFCKDAKVFSPQRMFAVFNLLFVKVNSAHHNEPCNPDHCLNLDEFVEVVVRMAALVYSKHKMITLAEKLNRLMEEHVKHAGTFSVPSGFDSVYRCSEVKTVFVIHRGNLFKIYKSYSHEAQELRLYGIQSIDQGELMRMVTDAKLISRGVTPEITRRAFLQCNFDDLMQESHAVDDRKFELTFDEFFEVLARIEYLLRPAEDGVTFAERLDSFLSEISYQLFYVIRRTIVTRKDHELARLQADGDVRPAGGNGDTEDDFYDQVVEEESDGTIGAGAEAGAANEVVPDASGDGDGGGGGIPPKKVRRKKWVRLQVKDICQDEGALLSRLHQWREDFKHIYFHYTAAVVDGTADDVMSMSALEFYLFCKDCRLMSSKTDFSRLNVLFVHVNVTHDQEGGNPDKCLTQDEFVEVIVRIANELFLAEEGTLERAVTRVMEQHVLPNASKVELPSGFPSVFRSSRTQAVLVVHRSNLFKIYKAYANKSKELRKYGIQCIDQYELMALVKDAKLVSQGVTTDTTRRAFLQCNMDDLLAEKSSTDTSKAELTFDEFLECIARLEYLCRENNDGVVFAQRLHTFISELEYNMYHTIRSTIVTKDDHRLAKLQKKEEKAARFEDEGTGA